MKENNQYAKRAFMALLGVTFSYIGAACCPFARVGSGSLSAFQYSTSVFIGVTLGTVSLLLQGCFVLGQFLLERKSLKRLGLLQLAIAAYGSMVVNFFLYQVLGSLPKELPYAARMLIFLCGVCLNGLGGSLIAEAGLFEMPMDHFLRLLAGKNGHTLRRYQQAADFLMLAAAAVICLTTDQPFRIREGTVINALMIGRIAALSKPWIRRIFGIRKYG